MPKDRAHAQNGPGGEPSNKLLHDNRHDIEALTVEDISRSGKFSPAHVRNLIARGELPSFSVGRCRRVLLADYLAYLERLKQESKRTLTGGQ